MKSKHTIAPETRQYKCNECNFKCKSETDLNTHVKSNHTVSSDKLLKCKICEYQYDTKTALKRHINDKHTLRLGYKCKNRMKKEGNVDNMEHHVREHLTEPLKNNLTCVICGKQEKTLETLRQHVQTEHLNQHSPTPRRKI